MLRPGLHREAWTELCTAHQDSKVERVRTTSTEVEETFAGHGIGSIELRDALEDVRRQGFEVLRFCPFVNSFISEHREFVDLVPEPRREDVGL
jgi:predicted GNAT family acetyltransferase